MAFAVALSPESNASPGTVAVMVSPAGPVNVYVTMTAT